MCILSILPSSHQFTPCSAPIPTPVELYPLILSACHCPSPHRALTLLLTELRFHSPQLILSPCIRHQPIPLALFLSSYSPSKTPTLVKSLLPSLCLILASPLIEKTEQSEDHFYLLPPSNAPTHLCYYSAFSPVTVGGFPCFSFRRRTLPLMLRIRLLLMSQRTLSWIPIPISSSDFLSTGSFLSADNI